MPPSDSDDQIFIDDGYTVERYIAASPRLYGAMRFSFRVLQPVKRAELLADTRDLGEVETLEILGGWMTHLLTKWDVKDSKGRPVPITKENVNKLQVVALTRLHRIVCYQTEGGDPAPIEETPREKSRDLPKWLTSPENEVAALEKNSPKDSAS